MNPKFLVEVVPTIPSDLVSVKEGAGIARKTERTGSGEVGRTCSGDAAEA